LQLLIVHLTLPEFVSMACSAAARVAISPPTHDVPFRLGRQALSPRLTRHRSRTQRPEAVAQLIDEQRRLLGSGEMAALVERVSVE